MKCGCRNELDSNYCKKCATPLKAFGATPLVTPVLAPMPTADKPVPPQDDPDGKPSRLKNKKRGPSKGVVPMSNAFSDQGQSKAQTKGIPQNGDLENEETTASDNEDGESIDFVPDVDGLAVESIETDVVQKVTFGQLIVAAQIDAQRQKK